MVNVELVSNSPWISPQEQPFLRIEAQAEAGKREINERRDPRNAARPPNAVKLSQSLPRGDAMVLAETHFFSLETCATTADS